MTNPHDAYWSLTHKKERIIKPHMNIPDQTYMTIREVAELFRVSQLTVKRWSNAGKLPCIRINSRGDRRYLRSEIDKIIGGQV